MNHRSNMDYVLAGFLAADQAALSYAVGEWARIWPLSALIRAMGAYFVRRNSRDELYRRVLERYIAMATEAGVPQAVFPEGGLTRDGRMREPKLGVLDYMLRGFRIDGERDLVFVPLGLNYDRVLEDRTLLQGQGQAAGASRASGTRCASSLHNASLMLRSEWHRFGYACVNFGTPISMREYCRTRGIDFQALVRRGAARARWPHLGRELMDAVGRIVPVLPVPLIASGLRRAAAARAVGARAQGRGRPPARAPGGGRRARLRPARRPRLRAHRRACACCACATWWRKSDGLFRARETRAAASRLLCQLDRAPALSAGRSG